MVSDLAIWRQKLDAKPQPGLRLRLDNDMPTGFGDRMPILGRLAIWRFGAETLVLERSVVRRVVYVGCSIQMRIHSWHVLRMVVP